MLKRSALALSFVALASGCSLPGNRAAEPPSGDIVSAVDGAIDAFDTHPIVAIVDAHGLAEEETFYSTLVRDPRFAQRVGNVVVEFGGASQQAIIDRYVAGENVSNEDLRKVWTDLVGFLPAVTSQGYKDFFAAVREANSGLPSERRIRVWLGDPPIDWSAMRNAADVRRILAQRDAHAAGLIDREILSKRRRALVIYGEGHIRRGELQSTGLVENGETRAAVQRLISEIVAGKPNPDWLTPRFVEALQPELAGFQAALASLGPIVDITLVERDAAVGDTYDVTFETGARRFTVSMEDGRLSGFVLRALNITDAVQRKFPGSFYIVTPYTGYTDPACSLRFEQHSRNWPVPALVRTEGLRPTLTELDQSGCRVLEVVARRFTPTMTNAQKAQRQARDDYAVSGHATDAMLYLGPAANLTVSPDIPDFHADLAYRAELSRRQVVRGLDPLPPPQSGEGQAAPLQKWRP